MDSNQKNLEVSNEQRDSHSVKSEVLRQNLLVMNIFPDLSLGLVMPKFRKRAFEYELIGGV